VTSDTIFVGCFLMHRPESSPIHSYTCLCAFFLLLVTVTLYCGSGGIMPGPCCTRLGRRNDSFIHVTRCINTWIKGACPPHSQGIKKWIPPPRPDAHKQPVCRCIYVYMCVCAVRESVFTLKALPSHTYTLIRPGTWHESFSYEQIFLLLIPPPLTGTKNRSYTKDARLLFEIIKVFISSNLCVGVCMCTCDVWESAHTHHPPLPFTRTHSCINVTWLIYVCNVRHWWLWHDAFMYIVDVRDMTQ